MTKKTYIFCNPVYLFCMHVISETASMLEAGVRVVRGSDWSWGEQVINSYQ